jgi:uncharacterized protein YjbI with pentapeptide repeats
VLAAFLLTAVARGDIYRWEYINPADHSQGKQPSAQLTPGGAGVSAAPGAVLSSRDLTTGYLIGADLTSATLTSTKLTDSDLSNANLTGANLRLATLTNATLAGSQITGASFSGATGLTPAQIASTGSYAAHDLNHVNLGVSNLPFANFSNFNLTGAIFDSATLNNANLSGSNLSNGSLRFLKGTSTNFSNTNLQDVKMDTSTLKSANFTGADLRRAVVRSSSIQNAIFTGADIRGADFLGCFMSLAQLYSTASYQAHDLTGTNLYQAILAGGDFHGMNFTNAILADQDLTGTDFTDAEIRGAIFSQAPLALTQIYSTASYKAHDLSGSNFEFSDLTGIDLSNMRLVGTDMGWTDLTNANFRNSDLTKAKISATTQDLTGVDLTGAVVRAALMGVMNQSQFYSTASYQKGDLPGIIIALNATGWDLHNVNLQDSDLSGTTLTSANLSGADLRGGKFSFSLSSANQTNTILSDGTVHNLQLVSSRTLIVRDYDTKALPVTIQNSWFMNDTGVIDLVFESDAWGSPIKQSTGYQVTLGGTLRLEFAEGTDVAGQVGRTFHVFDWTGSNRSGSFSISSPYQWDLTRLYTTGDIVLTAVPEPSAILVMSWLAIFAARRRRMN